MDVPKYDVPKYLVFTENMYSNIEEDGSYPLMWKAGERYLLREEYADQYMCETEIGDVCGIGKNLNRQGTENGLFDIVI